MGFLCVGDTMHLVLLAGQSPKNQAWIREVEVSVSDLFDTTYVHEYVHWAVPDAKKVDRALEYGRLSEYLDGLGDQPYVILAKSVGSAIAARSIHKRMNPPQACMFFGLPIRGLPLIDETDDKEYRKWLADYTIPTLFVQNVSEPDRFLGPSDLEMALQELGVVNHTFVHGQGDGHNYPVDQVRTHLERYVITL